MGWSRIQHASLPPLDPAASKNLPARQKRRLLIATLPAGVAACGMLLAGTDPLKAALLPSWSFVEINETPGAVGLSVLVGLVLFSTITALLHLTGRQRWTLRENALAAELMSTRSKLDRANVFLSTETQVVVAWDSAATEPDIEGDLALVIGTPVTRRVLAFGAWLPAEAAQSLDACVERLRQRGEAFRLALVGLNGRHLEAEGHAVGGRAVMRIRDISGDRLELARLRERHARAIAEIDALKTMLDALPNAAWMRGTASELTWVNAAYAQAVETRDAHDAVDRGTELLDRPAREAAAASRANGSIWHSRVGAVVAGDRRMLDVIDVPAPAGSAGFATDISELESVRADLGRQMEAHARTLDQLSVAVAMFDRAKRLVFYNAAYRQLWNLDAAFLDQKPSDSEILDRLRAERRLPEQVDFRAWKASLLALYQSVDTTEHIWYLPDSRTLRTVINPNPQGGVTYLFDDVTERFHLESRYNALIRVQGETLDTLREGVAVFGSDGRLKLFNSAFGSLWRIPPAELAKSPHVDTVVAFCTPLYGDTEAWSKMRSMVSGVHDERTGFERRMPRSDGTVIDCSAAPLPDGATLITFTDVTAGVDVERALKDRNQALVDAENLRNDFVHHVSYELRSPLTNIIGFTQLLGDGSIGPLNGKQREYAGYIMKSSAALLAIINDILDLATIDKDALELTLENVDIEATIEAAAEGLQDRLAESGIRLQVIAMDGIGSFSADAKRIRQILFNLLSNAIGFSQPGQVVTLTALRRPDEVVFKVSDEGRGIAPEEIDRVFDRFHSDTTGTRHRGVGLGLSMVRAFVELHGGQVRIDSSPGEGTTVTCIFPIRREAGKNASVA